MSTATETAAPDPLAAEIGRLAGYDVPVSVDVARAARDGRRRVHRRRVRVGAMVAVSGAAAVTAGAVSGPFTGADHARDSGHRRGRLPDGSHSLHGDPGGVDVVHPAGPGVSAPRRCRRADPDRTAGSAAP